MQDAFITRIQIEKVRHLQNIDIILSDTVRKHLILTGKNGCGKTSLLEAMRNNISFHQLPDILIPPNSRDKSGVDISYSNNILDYQNIIFIYISVERSKLVLPKSIEPMTIKEKTSVTHKASKDFLKYILSMDYQLYGARSENNTMLVTNLEKWFDSFLIALREIYNCQNLELIRDTKTLTFKIKLPGHEPFGLHEMADGYAAFLDIYIELLMRFGGAYSLVKYDQPAIAMVDEIETHLHVELQKQILPFLTRMFPNVQFITSTHSPFVITSLENAVVYDLEKKEQLDNPHFYSYETIVESFLGTNMYSNQLKNYFDRYKELCFKERTPEENKEFLRAKTELEIRSIPSSELYIAFQNLEKQRKAAKNDSSN